MRATGGVRFVSAVDSNNNNTAGVSLAAGGSAWSSISDRAAKANFKPVDSEEIVKGLAAIRVETWNYKSQDPSIRHIGPMPQDFKAAFKVGEDDKHITTIDSEGVAVAAIQGLYKMMREKDAEIAAQRAQLKSVREQVRALQSKQATLERQVDQIGSLKARLDLLEHETNLKTASIR